MRKITRDTFLYLEPKDGVNLELFAQCGSCRKFVTQDDLGADFEDDRCITLGSRVSLHDKMSCGAYEPWPTPDGKPNPEVVKNHAEELKKGMPGTMSPEEAGLVDRLVQCHRCGFEKGAATRCGLYEMLNSRMPNTFKLNTKIKPHACCNAQEPKDRAATHQEIAQTKPHVGAASGKLAGHAAKKMAMT